MISMRVKWYRSSTRRWSNKNSLRRRSTKRLIVLKPSWVQCSSNWYNSAPRIFHRVFKIELNFRQTFWDTRIPTIRWRKKNHWKDWGVKIHSPRWIWLVGSSGWRTLNYSDHGGYQGRSHSHYQYGWISSSGDFWKISQVEWQGEFGWNIWWK